MPPLPLVPDVYQVTTFGTLAGQPCDHVINYNWIPSAYTPAEACQRFATNDALAWMAAIQGLLIPAYTHTSSRCVYLGSLSVPEAVATAGGSGTATGLVSTFGSCVTVRHPVPIRGRGKQGRTNIPGPQAQQVTQSDGLLTIGASNAYLDGWTNYQNGLLTAVQGTDATRPALIVLDRKAATIALPGAPFIDATPNTHRRWQKRLSRHR